MIRRTYTAPLMAAYLTLPLPAWAQTQPQIQDECTKLIIYAVNQFCRLLPNGQNLCQPVALTGPSPACEVPAGAPLQPVPLAPPSLQMPNPMLPGMGYPFASSPVPFAPYTPFAPPALPGYAPPRFTLPQFAVPQFALPMPAPAMLPPMITAPRPMPETIPMPIASGQPARVEAPPPVATPAKAMPAPAPAVAGPPAAEIAPTSAPAVEAPVASVAAAAPASSTPIAPAQASAAPVPVPAAAPVPALTSPAAPIVPPGRIVVEEALAHFAFDSAELTQAGRDTLDAWLAHAPAGMPVLITGHADRLGPEAYNLELSLLRATAVRDHLAARGKDARDIRIVAKGETEPVKHCKGGPTPATKACLAPNRRVEIAPE